MLKSGGKSLILFLGLVVALILCQNFLAVGLADLLGISQSYISRLEKRIIAHLRQEMLKQMQC